MLFANKCKMPGDCSAKHEDYVDTFIGRAYLSL